MSTERCRYGRHTEGIPSSYCSNTHTNLKSFLQKFKNSFVSNKQAIMGVDERHLLKTLIVDFYVQSLNAISPVQHHQAPSTPSTPRSNHSSSSSPISSFSSYSISSSSSSSCNESNSPYANQNGRFVSEANTGSATLSQISSLINSKEQRTNQLLSSSSSSHPLSQDERGKKSHLDC